MTDQNEAEKCHACKGEGFLDTGDACDACCETGLCDPAAYIAKLRATVRQYGKNLRALGDLSNVDVDCPVPLLDNDEELTCKFAPQHLRERRNVIAVAFAQLQRYGAIERCSIDELDRAPRLQPELGEVAQHARVGAAHAP